MTANEGCGVRLAQGSRLHNKPEEVQVSGVNLAFAITQEHT